MSVHAPASAHPAFPLKPSVWGNQIWEKESFSSPSGLTSCLEKWAGDGGSGVSEACARGFRCTCWSSSQAVCIEADLRAAAKPRPKHQSRNRGLQHQTSVALILLSQGVTGPLSQSTQAPHYNSGCKKKKTLLLTRSESGLCFCWNVTETPPLPVCKGICEQKWILLQNPPESVFHTLTPRCTNYHKTGTKSANVTQQPNRTKGLV